jgi:hypothetical protein
VADHPTLFSIEGTHSAYLQAGMSSPGVSLGQAGDVPAGARSIRFLARNPYYFALSFLPGALDVRLNGEPVPLYPLWSWTDGAVLDVMFGGDVGRWADTTVELRIVILPLPAPRFSGFCGLDAISFSSEPVPEPGMEWWLVSLMVPLLARRDRSRRRAPRRVVKELSHGGWSCQS